MTVDDGLALALMLTVSMSVLVLASLYVKHPAPLVSGYVLHALVTLVLLLELGLWAPDAIGYDRVATELLAYWRGEAAIAPRVSFGKEGWPTLLAFVYRLFGHLPELGLIVNVTAVSLLIPVLSSAAGRLGAPERRTAWLVAIYPPVLFWGGFLLREALVWLCLAVIVRALLGLRDSTYRSDVVSLVFALAALFWLRGTAAILVGGGGLLALALTRRNLQGKGIVLVSGALVALGPLASRINEIGGAYDIDAINRSRASLSVNAASGYGNSSYDSSGDALLSLPSTLPRVFAGPFPWEWPGLNPLFILDGIGWLVLLFFVQRGAKHIGWRRCAVLILPALVLIGALGITSGNYGTLQRLRILSAVMLLPVAAAGVGSAGKRRAAIVKGVWRGSPADPRSRIATSVVAGRDERLAAVLRP